MSAYYNENDRFCAQWLRNLIAADLIAPGDVDERSIEDVHPDDLRGYVQCHFFAGIGGWSYALRLSGWPDDEPVWTGSCPCQPFSRAGKKEKRASREHLWPSFSRLISSRRPPVVFGEQVATKIGFEWLSLVQTDLEEEGYSSAAADLCAGSVGAPHIRQRLYWGALLADTNSNEPSTKTRNPGEVRSVSEGEIQSEHCSSLPWGDSSSTEIHAYADGYNRRSECGSLPLAYGVPESVGRVRAYGNPILPQVAAEFIAAYMECT